MISDYLLDNGLTAVGNGTGLSLIACSSEPANYAAVAAATLATKTNPVLALGAGSPSGRAVSLTAFSGTAISANGTSTHWALVDPANSRLLVTGAFTASQSLNTANTWGVNAGTLLRLYSV